jgi:hypothetical protein
MDQADSPLLPPIKLKGVSMKLIEALKKIQDLQRKFDDLKAKIARHSAQLDFETPVYHEQWKQVGEWVQACHDILAEILKLRIGIQRTNLATEVAIELGGKTVKKTIAEWIHRRRDLASREAEIWASLTDRGLKEGKGTSPSGDIMELKIVRYYSPELRDRNLEVFQSEPSIIDARLEVVNAVTDLME